MKQGGFVDTKTTFKLQKELEEAQFQIERIRQYELGRFDEMVERKYHGGGLQRGALALIGESASGTGGELVYTGSDAMVLNQARTDSLLTTALQKGLSGGGGDGTPIVVSSDNSVRSNISNVVSTSTVVTSNDSFTNAIVSSV